MVVVSKGSAVESEREVSLSESRLLYLIGTRRIFQSSPRMNISWYPIAISFLYFTLQNFWASPMLIVTNRWNHQTSSSPSYASFRSRLPRRAILDGIGAKILSCSSVSFFNRIKHWRYAASRFVCAAAGKDLISIRGCGQYKLLQTSLAIR